MVAKAVVPLVAESLAYHGLLSRDGAASARACRIVRGRLYVAASLLGDPLLRLLDESSPGRSPLLWLRLRRRLLRLESLERECRVALQRLTQELESEPMSGRDTGALVQLLRLRPREGFHDELVAIPPAGLLAQLCAPAAFAGLSRLLEGFVDQAVEVVGALTSGLHGMADVECATALWDLAEEARRIPELARQLEAPAPRMTRLARLAMADGFRSGLQALLNRFGHRGHGEAELSRPRWREDPEPLLSVIASYLGLASEASPHVAEWRRHWQRETALQRVRRSLRLRPLRRLGFERSLRVAQRISVTAANVQFETARFSASLRAAALELGARLRAAGSIDRVDDVFFLLLDELAQPGQALRERVALRRAQHAKDAPLEPAFAIDAQGTAVEQATRTAVARGALRGVPASPGRASGRVWIVRDAPAGGPPPGDVLVVPHADPAWTPLFAVAAAVVVETGGQASPALMIARELGIPSVAGVAGATQQLVEGEAVKVDGSRGIVARLHDLDSESGEAA